MKYSLPVISVIYVQAFNFDSETAIHTATTDHGVYDHKRMSLLNCSYGHGVKCANNNKKKIYSRTLVEYQYNYCIKNNKIVTTTISKSDVVPVCRATIMFKHIRCPRLYTIFVNVKYWDKRNMKSVLCLRCSCSGTKLKYYSVARPAYDIICNYTY